MTYYECTVYEHPLDVIVTFDKNVMFCVGLGVIWAFVFPCFPLVSQHWQFQLHWPLSPSLGATCVYLSLAFVSAGCP